MVWVGTAQAAIGSLACSNGPCAAVNCTFEWHMLQFNAYTVYICIICSAEGRALVDAGASLHM